MNISALHFVEILNIHGDCNGRLHGCHGYTLWRVVHLVKMFLKNWSWRVRFRKRMRFGFR